MANFNDYRRKASEKVGELADKASLLAKGIADKTRGAARIATLSAKIAGERERLRKFYAQIGELYCDLYLELPGEEFEDLAGYVRESLEIIDAMETELEQLRGGDDVED